MKNLSLLLLAASILVCASRVHAQEAIIQWQKCLGGSNTDEAYSIQQTTDGGYIVTGETKSNNGDVSENHGEEDVWVVKIDNAGNIEWQKCLGGSSREIGYCIQQTSDGGYVVAGYTESDNGDVFEYHGNRDAWVVKLDYTGNIEWQKCLGGSDLDEVFSILQIMDGGYIVAGYTKSPNDGDVAGNHGEKDTWIVKLDNTGTIEWQKCMGGSSSEEARSIQKTTDGGYIVAGSAGSNDGDVSGHFLSADFWVVKMDNTGNIVWQKCMGGSSYEYAHSIQQTTDGGYIVAGCTISNDGDVLGNHGWPDYWVVKLDDTGNVLWQKCLGGSNPDYAFSIQQTTDGEYIVAGRTQSNDGDVSGNHGYDDFWVVKLNNTGNVLWQKCLGGSNPDYAYSIQQTTDGGYIVAGNTSSNNGDVSGKHGYGDAWVVKLIESNISGLVFHDTNLSGHLDEEEQGVAGHLVKLEPGPLYAFTNNSGKYYFHAEIGEYETSYIPVNNWYATEETDYLFSVDYLNEAIDTLDFGIATRENSPDVAVYITGSPTRVGFETHYWITYKNWGTVTATGTVNVAFDPLLSFVSSTETPASQSGNVFTWNYGPMGPGVEHQFRIDFEVPGIEYLGDTLFSHAWITPFDPDTCLVNNYDTIYQEITGSCDPNDKRVSPAGIGDEGYVLHGQRLSYTIRFQNTGNDTAFTVLVRDTLDVSRMDIETFNVETYSHPVSWQFKNPNVMEFRFNNILLPDSTVNEPGSHGFVRFSVSPKPGLPDYTVVENTAHIYFDYNPAVVTNTTVNTYVTNIPVGINGQTSSDLIAQIYPNPASDKLNIAFTGAGSKSISMTNLLGQSVYRSETSDKQLSIDLSHFDKGMYFIVVSNNKQKSQVKVVIE